MSIENTPPANIGKLTGNEEWVKAGTQGATVWARKYGRKDWWWPIVFVELDCGLITIDVCGKTENWHLDDCAELRIGTDKIIDSEDFYLQTTTQTDAPASSPDAPANQKAETVICPRCEGWSPIQGLQDTCDLCRGTHRVSAIAAIAYQNEHFDQPTQPKETE